MNNLKPIVNGFTDVAGTIPDYAGPVMPIEQISEVAMKLYNAEYKDVEDLFS